MSSYRAFINKEGCGVQELELRGETKQTKNNKPNNYATYKAFYPGGEE